MSYVLAGGGRASQPKALLVLASSHGHRTKGESRCPCERGEGAGVRAEGLDGRIGYTESRENQTKPAPPTSPDEVAGCVHFMCHYSHEVCS